MKNRSKNYGGMKINITIAVAIIVFAIYLATLIGPAFDTKWALEDKMKYEFRRMCILDEEGILDNVAAYVEKHELPFDVYTDCYIEGEVRKPGYFSCTYFTDIYIFGRYLYEMEMNAEVELSWIPDTAN